MTQAQLDREAAERTRCPVCGECGGHKMMRGADCPLHTASTFDTPWYRLPPETVAAAIRGLRDRSGTGTLGVGIRCGQWRVTSWDGDPVIRGFFDSQTAAKHACERR